MHLGDHCESIWLPDAVSPNECRPCASNFTTFVECLKLNAIDTKAISYWWLACDEYISNCFNDHLSQQNCFNNGKCVVAAERGKIAYYFMELLRFSVKNSDSTLTLAVPRCECEPGFEGMFCERRIPNLCEDLSEADKCVHGKCAYNSSSMTTRCM